MTVSMAVSIMTLMNLIVYSLNHINTSVLMVVMVIVPLGA